MARAMKAFVLNEMQRRKDRNREYDSRRYNEDYDEKGYGMYNTNVSPEYLRNTPFRTNKNYGSNYNDYDKDYYGGYGNMPMQKGYGSEYYPMYDNRTRKNYERNNRNAMQYYGMGYIDIEEPYGDTKNYNIHAMMGDMNMKANINNMKMNEKMAIEWANNMDYATGEQGARWKPNDVKPFADKLGFPYGSERFWCFYAIMNAMYADYGKTLKKYGCDEPEIFAELAKDFIEDPDAVKNKTMIYYNFIAEH